MAHCCRGRLVSELFQSLPSREEYPDYFQIISTPFALDQIRVGSFTYLYHSKTLTEYNRKNWMRESTRLSKTCTSTWSWSWTMPEHTTAKGLGCTRMPLPWWYELATLCSCVMYTKTRIRPFLMRHLLSRLKSWAMRGALPRLPKQLPSRLLSLREPLKS